MADVLILYYSRYGNVAEMANHVARGKVFTFNRITVTIRRCWLDARKN